MPTDSVPAMQAYNAHKLLPKCRLFLILTKNCIDLLQCPHQGANRPLARKY